MKYLFVKRRELHIPNLFLVYFPLILGAFLVISCASERTISKVSEDRQSIYVGDRDLKTVIEKAPAYARIICDRSKRITISETIQINKPLIITGLHAVLPEKLAIPMLVVDSEGFILKDFELHGNRESVSQENRQPLVMIRAGNFRVEDGLFVNSSKDGVNIRTPESGGDVIGGVIRDIVGRENARDVVSIDGGDLGQKVAHILVENVRCYGSALRGAVEVSDGTRNVTVRNVYAERALYAVDVQQHGHTDKINRNVLIEDVVTRDCRHAIRTANSPVGHANLTIRDVTTERSKEPIMIKNTANVVLEHVRVIDQDGDQRVISLSNCDGVTIRDIAVQNSTYKGPALLLENTNHTLVDGVTLKGNNERLTSAVHYLISNNQLFSGLRITNIYAPDIGNEGILLERVGNGKKGKLSNYNIYENLTTVSDKIKNR